MYLEIHESGFFDRPRFLQNETENEFCKSLEIKNASIPRCILYFLQHMYGNRAFPSTYRKRARRANFLIYLRNILSKGVTTDNFSVRGSTFEVFSSAFLFGQKTATSSSLQMLKNTWFSCMC